MQDIKKFNRLASDLHLEFYQEKVMAGKIDPFNLADHIISHDEKDSNSNLILAGDILLIKYLKHFLPFFENLSNRFENIIWIFGNHEWFKNTIKTERLNEAKDILSHLKNIHILENDIFETEDFIFFGTTMWSDINHGDYLTALEVAHVSYDYKKIDFKEGRSYSKLRPRHVSGMFLKAKKFIEESLMKYKDSTKTKIVITHHAPLKAAIPEEYLLNSDFWSDFGDINFNYFKENEIEPDFWLHGHIHKTQFFKIGKTSIYSNPYGYDDVDKSGNSSLNDGYIKLFI